VSVSLIVAVADNGVIGQRNGLPWRLPEDLKRFKALTMGKPIIMGRKTYDSIGKPLPGRTNIVITRQPGLSLPGCVVAGSLPAAVDAAGAVDEVMVIGGAEIYRQALPMTQRVYLTRVHAQVEGDACFPALAPEQWQEVAREDYPADERHAHAFSFVILARQNAPAVDVERQKQ
jgi:dihydrofolate reductase